MKANRQLFLVVVASSLVGCSGAVSDANSFTLYRSSVTDKAMRIHVASFDSEAGEAYNQENCRQAELLFQSQPGVETKFWCEKGRFRK